MYGCSGHSSSTITTCLKGDDNKHPSTEVMGVLNFLTAGHQQGRVARAGLLCASDLSNGNDEIFTLRKKLPNF